MADSRVALTTGASSGIGLATVVELARLGLRSVGTVRSPAKARRLAEAAEAAGVHVETAVLDVTDAAQCQRVVARFHPTVVVNNAGYGITGAVEDVDDEEARRAIETMVVAPMRLARLALPSMRHAGEGRIVNVSSVYGRVTSPLTGWYQGCKHALEAVSDALRTEVAAAGVKVVLVEPGLVRTAIWRGVDDELAARAGSPFAPAYGRLLAVTRLADPIMARPAQVAKTIGRAVTARTPRDRYLVGWDAHAVARAAPLAPAAVKDRVTRAVLGL